MTIYTIGFTRKSAEQFFTTLAESGVQSVLDVRLNNTSQLAGFTRRNDLCYFLKSLNNISYAHLVELAPEAQMLEDYRAKRISWDEYAEQYTRLLRSRPEAIAILKALEPGDCLLCSEAEPHYCHRRLAAGLAQELRPGLQIQHLET